MAYKEFTISLTVRGTLNYLNGSTYAEARDAVAANQSVSSVGGAIGQRDDFIDGVVPHGYDMHRLSIQFNLWQLHPDSPIEYTAIKIMPYDFGPELVQDFDLVVQNGQPDYPHDPVVVGDFDRTHYSGDGGSITASTLVYETYSLIVLNATGRGWVNPDALTKFIIRSSRDIAGNEPVAAANEERKMFYLLTPSEKKIQLVVRVTLSVPECTTNEPTDIDSDNGNVTLNCTMDNSGYWLNTYGIQWKKGLTGTVYTNIVGGAVADVDTFIKNKTGWDTTATYYYRAYGTNDAGTGYGEWVEVVFAVGEITTQAVSQKSYECAMGNGTVVAGENITERGFEVKLSYSGTLGNYVFHKVAGFVGDVTLVGTVWEGTLVKTESETGTFTAEAYSLVLGYPSVLGNPDHVFDDKLFECESYTYRAYMIIGDETYYGDWVAFTTLCYPVGHQDDDTPPIIIPPFVPPEEPIEPIEPFDFPEFPPLVYPEMPNGYWSGMFYYRKAYTKKDLDELRRKCRIFLDNSVEYALVLNHNMRVLQQFLNMMHIYLDVDEFNGFKDLISTQHLNALAHEELDISDFKAIINNFISNSVNNTMNVNGNFRLIRNGLNDYITSEDGGFTEEKVTTRIVREGDPDVEMLKKKIDGLSREMAQNYAITQHNLYVTRSMIL